MADAGTIIKVSGPLVLAEGLPKARVHDVVRVGEMRMIGEIIELHRGVVSVQVYEDTAGLGPGDPVYSTGAPLSVELGPGLISSIYDGIQRPLDKIVEKVGSYITRGVHVPGLDREKQWHFEPRVEKGAEVQSGDIIGVVRETSIIEHRVMVPPRVEGKVCEIKEGEFTVEDVVCTVGQDGKMHELTMMQPWPVREPRPYVEKLPPEIALVTGQRILDTFAPICKGGTATCPGPFGAGKTVIQHQLAKWADAEVVVFVGCGERGNEMTDVLIEFPELQDPKSGEPLMQRTVLIANTSNMPVAAREASIYTGITIAEYFRDMGYSVALMADSTSRWAEALREMSGRLEEMPGEEGYPAYLPARLAQFYERAGRVVCLGQEKRVGALSAIGAVSPPGGDLSDPVVQATLKVVKCFWSLEDWLAYERHFPAINWLTSYSLYLDTLSDYYREHVSEDFVELRTDAMALLQTESELKEVARLVGEESLGPGDRLTLLTARSIREDFLHQNAFHPVDTYASFAKQYKMLRNIMTLHKTCEAALERGVTFDELAALPVRQEIARARYVEEDNLAQLDAILEKIEGEEKAASSASS
jgi:V/A-type H+-transporting ATPase subunit A